MIKINETYFIIISIIIGMNTIVDSIKNGSYKLLMLYVK